ncbi:hypothetical protein MHYP_G00057600 [Metynnis hypsauchen]
MAALENSTTAVRLRERLGGGREERKVWGAGARRFLKGEKRREREDGKLEGINDLWSSRGQFSTASTSRVRH